MTLLRLAAVACITLLGTACTTPASHTAVAPMESDLTAPEGDVEAAAVASNTEADPLVCKNVIPAGTRVAQRTCMRRSEIEKAERDGRDMLEEVQRRGAMDTVRRE